MHTNPSVTYPTIGPGSAGVRMTPEEFDVISDYDEQYRYELIHGVLIVNPIPSEAEADPNELLGHWLRTYQESHPDGKSLDATLPERYVRLADSRRRADRVIWAGLGRRPDPTHDVPTIVVEFVSHGKRNWLRDYVEKRDEYLALGVKEYWVVDRFNREMTVFQANADTNEQVFGESATYRTALLPGFELPVAKLMSASDAWEQ